MARPVAIGEVEPAWHLHLRVPAVLDLGDGTLVELTALVDTGSEANLIRRDLVESRYTESCGTKVGFWAVNNQSLGGNHRKLTCKLLIEGVEVDTKGKRTMSFPFKGYTATMDVDLILSYEWLARQNFVVHARRHGVTVDKGESRVWVNGIRKGVEVKKGPPTVCKVGPLEGGAVQWGRGGQPDTMNSHRPVGSERSRKGRGQYPTRGERNRHTPGMRNERLWREIRNHI